MDSEIPAAQPHNGLVRATQSGTASVVSAQGARGLYAQGTADGAAAGGRRGHRHTATTGVLPAKPEPENAPGIREGSRRTAGFPIVKISMTVVPRMMTCRWAARRLQRYLDQDPSGLLPDADLRRLEAHLATCEKCQGLASEYRSVSGMLARLSLTCEPDVATIERVQQRLELVLDEE